MAIRFMPSAASPTCSRRASASGSAMPLLCLRATRCTAAICLRPAARRRNGSLARLWHEEQRDFGGASPDRRVLIMSVPAEPKGSILTPAGWIRGGVRIKDRRIAGIDGDLLRPDMTPESPFIVPGFIDLHVHGGLGGECMSGEAGVRQTLKYHAAHGTVALAPTTVTAPVPQIESVRADIAATQAKPRSGEAAVLG